jgi:signal transduction histidine kinase
MNKDLQSILNIIQQSQHLGDEEKNTISKSLKDANKELEITSFKLDRTEKVKKTTAILLEETITELEQKRKAVEAQNKELEIESSLERVRTVAMSMNKPDDMLHVCRIISDQLELLNVKETRNVQTAIFYKERGTYMNYEYYAKHDKTFITETTYTDNKIHQDFADKMLKGNGEFMIAHIKGDEVKDWLAYQKTTNVFIDDYLNTASSLNYYWFSLGPVALGISTYSPLNEDETNLFKRFLKVFELSYRRYLDIEKAEAQARESQIQLALERVRARTMAMQKSDELSETVFILFQQFKELGENPDQATIGIINEDEWVIEYWVTMYGNQMNRVFKFSIDEPNVTNKIYKGWKEQKKSLVIDLSGKELYDFATYRASKGGAAYNEAEKRRVINVAFFSKGLLNVQSIESHSAESILLLERFAKVFEQTYTRFLDLKNAEGQARESQIEASLERVRSRSMAMQKSEELKEVIQVVFEQFVHLNIHVEHTGFIMDYKERNDMFIWLADKHAVPFQVTIPYFDCAHWNSFNEAKEKGTDFFANHLSFEEKNKFYKDLFKYISGVPEETLEYFFSVPGLAISTVLLENVGLYIENFSGTPYTDKENNTLMRFGKVFQQTYTRFLDLQKAEAQTREATIEAALEKVRGRAMAMHNSNDLSSTVSMVFTELGKLGINPIRSGVGLLNKESHKAQLYSATSSADGDSLALIGWVVLSGHPVFENIYETWLKNEDYFPELSGEDLKSYYENLLSGLSLPSIPDWQSGQKQYGHFFSFSVGCLYAWSETPYNDTEIKILKRFASIVDLTFRRYIELQKSETNAREAVRQASLDRVRAEIASMRTPDDLEKITPLIWSELTVLGIPFIRCGVFIMDNQLEQIHTFLSTPDGKAIAAFHIPYSTPGNINQALHHWRQKENYIDHWDESSFKEFADTLVKQGALPSSEQYLQTIPHGGFHLHFLPFLQGMLYVGNSTRLDDEEIKLIQSVADAFSTAYARYEDFNKLEAAKQIVEKTLVDLKQAQQQLVQSEKMASLGELTAGIAHEIQNPLNFVNNFSEVSNELIDEMNDELNKGEIDEAKAIANDIRQNLEKINHHGKRADAIVKGMLQHSRSSTGAKEPTDINALADEYLRLSYHGLRAKENSLNATMNTDFDNAFGKIRIIPQDIGRVLLNLYNNAFYAVSEKKKQQPQGYEPTVSVSTKKNDSKINISVKDNGNGIPQKVVDKIFQPFFTTKPTGQGTGLGLSLSYDIIKAHGGEIKVETNEGEGSEFIIQLPLSM